MMSPGDIIWINHQTDPSPTHFRSFCVIQSVLNCHFFYLLWKMIFTNALHVGPDPKWEGDRDRKNPHLVKKRSLVGSFCLVPLKVFFCKRFSLKNLSVSALH